MSSRDQELLHPDFRSKVKLWLQECDKQAAKGDKYILVCTYRSELDQLAAYSIGRTKPGRIITNARPGRSLHNKIDNFGKPASEAVDFGVIRWGKYISDGDDAAYKLGGAIAEGLELEWAGRWRGSLKEACHIQMKGTV